MGAVLRWLCSYLADEVNIQHNRRVTYGDCVLLCSIELVEPNAKFTNYHENRISVSYHDREAEADRGDCRCYVTKVNSRQLDVFCFARRLGRATVKLDLGKWYLVKDKDQDLTIEIVPSTPDHFNDVIFITSGAVDESFLADTTVMYRNQWSIVEAEMADRYDNVVRELGSDYDINLQLVGDEGEVMKVEYKDEEFRNERLRVKVKINEAGEHNLAITLVNRNSRNAVRLKEISIQVIDAPLDPVGSNFPDLETCVAGEEIQLEVVPFDVFGCQVPVDSTIDCSLDEVILNSLFSVDVNEQTTNYCNIKQAYSNWAARTSEEHTLEQVNIRKTNTSGNLHFAVTVCFKVAGHRKLMLDLSSGFMSHPKYINVKVLPSTPDHFNDVRFTTHGGIDESFSADPTVMYRNQWSILEAEVFDQYDNTAHELENECNIDLQLINDGGDVMEYNNAEFRNGRFQVQVKINEAGKHKLFITFTRKSGQSEEVVRLKEIPIQVFDAPLYLAGSKFPDPETCVAGKEFQFEVVPLDVFGCQVPSDSTTDCNLTEDMINSLSRTSDNEETANDFNIKQDSNETETTITEQTIEQVNIRKTNTSGNIHFVVTVCFKVAGHRKLMLDLSSGFMSYFKDIDVEVLPSTSDHFNDVRFTTHGAVDENFSANPTVMYRNQWSIVEAEMVDRYDNVVHELSSEYNIDLQLVNDEGKVMMEYIDVEFRSGRFQVQVKIKEGGKHKLFITLTHKSGQNEEVIRMKEIPIQVIDAPLYLAGSTFPHPETCVAGKEFQFEVVPLDVFGCQVPSDSTTDCNLTVDALNSPSELNENFNEIVDFKVMKNESNVVIRVSVVLKEAGFRKVKIIDKNNKSKELSIQVDADESDVHWKLTAPKKTAYKKKELILTVRLFDCFNNEVSTDGSENIPQLIKRDGPDGLRFTEEPGNKAATRCYFGQTGKYDFCLANEDGGHLADTSFSITVQDDYRNSTIKWIPEYDEIPDQPVFPEDGTFQCRLRLRDEVGCDYKTEIAKDRITLKYGNTEMKNVKVSSCPNDVGSYKIVVPLKNLEKDDARPRFWCFVDGQKIKQSLILRTFEGFEKHDDDRNCVVEHRRYEFMRIVCYGVTRNDIIGSDFAHLNNIKRVCRLEHDPKVVETYRDEGIDDDFGGYSDDDDDKYDYDDSYVNYDNYDYVDDDEDEDVLDDDNDDDYDNYDNGDNDDVPTTTIELPFKKIVWETVYPGRSERDRMINIFTFQEIEGKIQDCRNILLRLLRAIFYRKEAFELDKYREDWKERARENYRKIKRGENIDRNLPHFCSQIKEKYARLMRRYHDAACEEFFQFFNTERDQSEIDLHGLLVVDEKKLRDYERQLRSRGRRSLAEVKRKIDEERDHGNEAIRKLRERLDNYDMKKAKKEKEPWLEIIVGSGHHSKVRENSNVRQRIRPKVEEFLRGRRLEFSPVNKGALVVTFEEYSGREPCFGEFYCTKCDNRWGKSRRRSWIGEWQACYYCHEKKGMLEKCYPLKQRFRRKQQRYNPRIVSRNQRPVQPHLQELCGKCRELRGPCPGAMFSSSESSSESNSES